MRTEAALTASVVRSSMESDGIKFRNIGFRGSTGAEHELLTNRRLTEYRYHDRLITTAWREFSSHDISSRMTSRSRQTAQGN